MRIAANLLLPLCLSLGTLPALQGQEAKDPAIARRVAAVDEARLHGTVAALVGFGTRNTLSDTRSPVRGIGAARTWLAAQFKALAAQPGSRLQPFEDRFTCPAGPRVPQPVEIVNVGAVLPGTDPARAKEAIVLTGHYDSRASDVLDATSDAPGAVDDGSGTAMALEAARVMADARPAVTVYFVAVAGEEQGLLGSDHLARRLKAEGVQVLAMLSVDIAGNSEGQDGVKDDTTGRIWSEGVPATETPAQRRLRLALGTENDGASREWARYLQRLGERYVENLRLLVMLRRDRIARGSDHMSFSDEGFPAACLRESHENYRRQHQDVRVEKGVAYGDDLAHFDAHYAARLCRGVVAALASLSAAPAAPKDVTLGGAVSPDTRLRWTLPDDPRIAGILLFRRRDDGVAWQRVERLPKGASVILEGVVPDSSAFAVATVDADGHESLPQPPSHLE